MLLKSAIIIQDQEPSKNMSVAEVVMAFMSHSEIHPMPNDFHEYWTGLWKPLTQRCLNVAKHQFVMQKAFELFKANTTRHNYSHGELSWSDIFVRKEEEEILKSLCRSVKLQEEEFMDYGLNHHRNRCRKYHAQQYSS